MRMHGHISEGSVGNVGGAFHGASSTYTCWSRPCISCRNRPPGEPAGSEASHGSALGPQRMSDRTYNCGAPPWKIWRPILGKLVTGGPELARLQVCTRMAHISSHAHLAHAHAHTFAPSPMIPAHVRVPSALRLRLRPCPVPFPTAIARLPDLPSHARLPPIPPHLKVHRLWT